MRRSLLVPAALCGTLLLSLAGGPVAGAVAACDRIASPTGDDGAAGSEAAPYRTVSKLVSSLGPGQTGCLRTGTYREDVAIARPRITLVSYPGEAATLVGRLWIKQGADQVVIASLRLDGANASALPSPTVNANGAQFIGNDVTNDHTSICFDIGSSQWGRAVGTILRGNRIHDCGRQPSTNYDHGIYVSAADGTQIIGNTIYANADRGIQLYPDAQGTIVRGNVIDGNGEGIIFSGDEGKASSDTLVEYNVITNATIRANVESWYPAGNPVGTNNIVRSNCLSGGVDGTVDTGGGGFTATTNTTVADPGYVDRANGDFRLSAASPCAAILAAGLVPGAAPPTIGDSGAGPAIPSSSPPPPAAPPPAASAAAPGGATARPTTPDHAPPAPSAAGPTPAETAPELLTDSSSTRPGASRHRSSRSRATRRLRACAARARSRGRSAGAACEASARERRRSVGRAKRTAARRRAAAK